MTPPPPPPRGRGRRQDDELEYLLRRSRRRRGRGKARHKRRTALIFATLLIVVLAVIASSVGAVAKFRSDCSLKDLKPVQIGQNSFVYAANGSLLGAIPAERNRQPVALWRVSPWMRKATVSIEDHRFYEHGGVDYEGIARAAWKDLRAGHVVQGGSTITQQLVRNLFDLSQERTVSRKLKEACLAVKVDRSWSKQRILAGYLNFVYYGNRAYGIEAAAQTYFSKPAKDLTVREAALIAGLPQAPSEFDPFKRPRKALARRNEVLRAMLDTGAITRARYDRASASNKLDLKAGSLYSEIKEPYFFSYVRDLLVAEYGAQTVRSGGLRVYTTIDRRLQRIANRVMQETLPDPTDPAAALVSINPGNGAIRAMAARTPGKKKNQYNLAAQGQRQTGSTFKTFDLTAAIAQGMDPDTTYYTSTPFTYYPPDVYSCEDERAWCVATYGHTYLGSVSVTRATLSSDNTVYAQLTLDTGPEKIAQMARRLGIRESPLNGKYPSIGLGAQEVTPLEMASAYATIAAGGIYSKPFAIRRVVFANGKKDTQAGWGQPERQRAIPDWVAAKVTDVLEQNHHSGTGTLAASYFYSPAAGKTGTTENYTDAWYCGITPALSTTVWMGYQRGKIPMYYVHGYAPVAGGTLPALMWGKYTAAAFP
ncbi:MAG: transglycosylase domain-containing protein, partial [Gaiellaceae bacterium]